MTPKYKQMELSLRRLADRTRLRLLNLMGADEVCVCYFVECWGRTSRRFSRHLATCVGPASSPLRRDGKWMHYPRRRAVGRTRRARLRGVRSGSATTARCSRIAPGLVACAARRRRPSAFSAPRPASLRDRKSPKIATPVSFQTRNNVLRLGRTGGIITPAKTTENDPRD